TKPADASTHVITDKPGGTYYYMLTTKDPASATSNIVAAAVTTTTTTTTTTTSSSTTSTATTTSTTSTTIQRPTIQAYNATAFLAATTKTQKHTITGSGFKSGLSIKLAKNGQEIPGKNIQVNQAGTQVAFEIDLPTTDTAATTVGHWDLLVIQDNITTSVPRSFLIEYPEGLFYYPTKTSISAMKAAGPAAQPRIAYTLSADKPIQLIIYDVITMRPVFHRTFAAGEPGGKLGYNEFLWDGVTDQGTTIANGSYVLQAFSNGNMIGQTYFVVID
ncbi:MAG: hypothetical protein ABID35_02760, partial [Candidatus Margulisiibacteriota bacterium]